MLEYFNALERIKKNKPRVVKKNSKITKASVAREAGKDPSAIKASRPEFSTLIDEIKKAEDSRVAPLRDLKTRYDEAKASRDSFRELYEKALSRELMLIKQLHEIEKKLSQLTNDKVTFIDHK